MKDDTIINTGKFIMMPENEMASFKINLKKNSIDIIQDKNKKSISLLPIYDYEDYYSAPKGRKLIKSKLKVIHISKNVFNNDGAIEILIQAGFAGSSKEGYDPFVIDFLLNENGEAKLIGSTYQATEQGSHPVFSIIDGKAYYGIYDDRNLGNSLYPYQKLNAPPFITDNQFTNGEVILRKKSWEYSRQKGITVERAIDERKENINRLIGDKKQSNIINHSIQHYDMDYNPTDIQKIKVEMVATYNSPNYNERGIRSLMSDWGESESNKTVPVLMFYLEDERSIDLPADDYGNTTISALAERALSNVFSINPEFLINYSEKYVNKDLLNEWWKTNKHLYN